MSKAVEFLRSRAAAGELFDQPLSLTGSNFDLLMPFL